jgi:hypothetical protein
MAFALASSSPRPGRARALSSSTAPALLIGDNFLASKPACGYSYFSLPLLPCSVRGAISQPVKPTVGLPGDRIQMKDGLINHRKRGRGSPSAIRVGQTVMPRASPRLSVHVGLTETLARSLGDIPETTPGRRMISLTEQTLQRFLV